MDLVSDVRRALRTLMKSKGFFVTALVTLGLGIGAATAVFTLVEHMALRPLPYDRADKLVFVDSLLRSEGDGTAWGVSEAGYFHLRDNNRTFEEMGAYGSPGTDDEFTVVRPNGGLRVSGVWVRATLLKVLGARPALGRLIEEGDDGRGIPTVALLGHAFWLREYGGDPRVVGTTLELEGGRGVEVIGVLEPGFNLPERSVDVWVPLGLDPARPPDRFHGYKVLGRLKPDASVDDASRDLADVTARFPEAMPGAYSDTFMRESGFVTRVTPLRDHVLGRMASALWILLGSVSLVLVIACANVANLFLVRAEARRRERAIRLALGTGRLGLFRDSIAESLVLSVAAGASGLVLANGLVRLVLAVAPPYLPRLHEISIDGVSIAGAMGIAVVVGIVLGCVPFLHPPGDLATLRGEGTAVTVSRHRHAIRGAMVVSQLALALVLLAGAGLMLRSFDRLRNVQPGLDSRQLLAVEVFLPQMHARYQRPQALQQFYRELLDRVRALPGVRDASAGTVPLNDAAVCFATYVEGTPVGATQQPPCIGLYTVTPGFFQTLSISLQGREPQWARVESTDDWDGREVVVTRALANRLWPGDDPIGKGLRQPDAGPPYARVVGVTGDLRSDGLDRPPAEVIFGQVRWQRGFTLLVKTNIDAPAQLAVAVRNTIAGVAPMAAIGTMRTMEQAIAASPAVARASFTVVLLAIGATMGLLLSAVGLFGVLAYVVGQRRSEIGIRIALGAQAHEVATMVVRHSLQLAIIGTVLGLAGALLMGQLLRPLLFEVTPTDPATLGSVALLLILVALVASWLPAWRAARTDAMRTLRQG